MFSSIFTTEYQIDSNFITGLYYTLVFIAIATKIRDFRQIRPKPSKNFQNSRKKFLISFFSYTLFDQIFLPYISVVYKINGYTRNQIANLQFLNQIFAIIGSSSAAFLLKHYPHHNLIQGCSFARAISILLLFIHSFPTTVIFQTINGFGNMFAKIIFDDWVIVLFNQYQLNSLEMTAIVNGRATTQFLLDTILGTAIGYSFKKWGITIILMICFAGFSFSSISPPFFMKPNCFPPEESKNSKPQKQDEQTNVENKETFFQTFKKCPYTILYFMVDISYCFLSNILKVYISTPYKNKSLPLTLIVTSYNCAMFIGSSVSLFVTKYISIQKGIYISLFIFITSSLLCFYTYQFEICALMSTLMFGFGDGFFMPLTNCQRKEIYPSSIRPTFLSAQRLLGALIASNAVKYIAAHTDNYLGLVLLIPFTIALISYSLLMVILTMKKKND